MAAVETDILIIGGGISGMTTALELIRQGKRRNFIIVEKSTQFGGTWNDNKYPGCCCDVWSHLYSLSFEPNPNWSREYSGSDEIQQYLIHIAHKYGLYQHVRFNTSVVDSQFDNATGTWNTNIRVDGGKAAESTSQYNIRSRFLVSGVGQLNAPLLPAINGLDSFEGPVMHSSRWDQSVSLEGKRIGVIGNGASSVQIVPEIAKLASSVVVFQRSPVWIVPRNDRTIGALEKATYRHIPLVRKRLRSRLMDMREAFYSAVFDADSSTHYGVKMETEKALSAALPGDEHAELRARLTPNYPPGCKRILISDDYFPALRAHNVTLETAPIQGVSGNNLQLDHGWNSEDGNHDGKGYELDIIICATGFDATRFLSGIDIVNGQGVHLHDQWADAPVTHLGITVPNFPNFAILFGPNTNLGHNSIILMIEAQAKYITNLVSKVMGGLKAVEPSEEICTEWYLRTQAKLSTSALASDLCNSWYKTDAGVISTNYSEQVATYQQEASQIDWANFWLVDKDDSRARGKGREQWARVVEETRVSDRALVLGGICALVTSLVLGWRRGLLTF